jgi:hypothetical protein
MALVGASVLAAMSASAMAVDGFTLIGERSEAAKAVGAERRFVHPVTSPYFHEDSFITSDVRAWWVYHSFPQSIALNGGDANVYAVQLRLAITEQLQFVAYKDGYVDLDSGLLQDNGWNDLAAGLKYAFLQDYQNDVHAAVGVGYQFAVGDPSVLQNDQELRLWASVNKGFDRFHLGATLNYLIHTGTEDALGSSDRLFWHVHADYWVNQYFSPVVELNGYHTVNEGNNTPLPFSGADIANLGGGDDLVTLGLGFEVRPIEDQRLALRTAYEMAISDGEDLFGYRWTTSLVWGF